MAIAHASRVWTTQYNAHMPEPSAAARSPRVTEIIPHLQLEQRAAYSVGSVLRQSFTDFELLVVGDGCTDDSEQVVTALPIHACGGSTCLSTMATNPRPTTRASVRRAARSSPTSATTICGCRIIWR